ncbi:hypothetical protein [Streptomyces sp. NPDC014623]|uniref:hypothetical protein n=1 Tax=Streptomyces sp. NPDC014623 TaxID=3364875 RepID=UPI0036F6B8DD
MEQRDVQGHHEQLAVEYGEHRVYGPDRIPWMAARIAEALRLTAGDRMAGIGGGTGLSAREAANQIRPGRPVLCADPSEALGSSIVQDDEDQRYYGFDCRQIVTEGFRTIRTGERVRFHVSGVRPDRAESVIRLDQPDPSEYYG